MVTEGVRPHKAPLVCRDPLPLSTRLLLWRQDWGVQKKTKGLPGNNRRTPGVHSSTRTSLGLILGFSVPSIKTELITFGC